MGITEMIAGVFIAMAALLAGIMGHKLGKSSGVSEGKELGKVEAAATQNKAAAEAANDRVKVEVTVSTAADAELDDGMRPYFRKD